MAVRDVALVVSPEDIVDTENLTTLFAVVNKLNKKSWYDSYETLCGYVVSDAWGWGLGRVYWSGARHVRFS